MTLFSFLLLPLELLLIGLLLLCPQRFAKPTRIILATLITVGIAFKLADLITFQIYARPFSPIFDSYLILAGLDLLHGATGLLRVTGITLGSLLLILAILASTAWALQRLQHDLRLAPQRNATLLVVGLLGWLGAHQIGFAFAATPFYHSLAAHVIHTVDSVRDIKAFGKIVNQDELTNWPRDQLFEKLKGKDVMVVFVESYGRTLIDNPDFAPHMIPLLQAQSQQLSEAGFAVRSGYLTSPTSGGISWLAHATTLSGLWIDSQNRYDSLMTSSRYTLNRLFAEAGWRSVAVMPGITAPWPESRFYGYDQIYDAHNLGYKGLPFNWITMPDQYTLSAFEMFERQRATREPVMAEIALLSSHAPWTPIPRLVPWDTVADGAVFSEQAQRGDTPEQVWQDVARVRLHYRECIAYTISTLVSYLLQYGDDNLVVLVLGDHQPATLVTQNPDNHDVPVHLITRDKAVMAATSSWAWTEGLLPTESTPVWRMDRMRDQFVNAFSSNQLAITALQ